MNIDYLSKLPPELFVQQITYLPFKDVISLCSRTNKKIYRYCTDPAYKNIWKYLIDNTFGNTYNYKHNLKLVQDKLGLSHNDYNYLVYTRLVNFLDPVTQLRIYYYQKDNESFNNNKFDDGQRFLAYYLVGDIPQDKESLEKMRETVEFDLYDDIALVMGVIKQGNKYQLSPKDTEAMTYKMASKGSPLGVKIMLNKGADISNGDYLIAASRAGNLNTVKYLIEQGADIHAGDDDALRWASENGHLDVVKYLVKEGADIHANNNDPVRLASMDGHLDIVKYLIKEGADIHAENDEALRLARENGHTDVVKYLLEQDK